MMMNRLILTRALPGSLLFLLLLFFTSPVSGQDYESLKLDDLSAFEPAGPNWSIAGAVTANPEEEEDIKARKGTGILVNQPTDKHRTNLVTRMEHGDIDLELEFMMARHSNSGIYLQGRYEIQLLDSWGKASVTYGDCGGIYQRWDESRPERQKGYQGYAPRMNVSRAPGLWQKLFISFRAPRFDRYGNKTANARILEVRLNGVTIHKNVELTGPTRGGKLPEATQGAILIQGDHGPVAFRNIRYAKYDKAPVQVSSWNYAVYEHAGNSFPDLSEKEVLESGKSEELTHEMVREDARFALRLSGEMPVTSSGEYRFDLLSRGFGRLLINGEEIIPASWFGGKGGVELTAGRHQVSLEYYKPDSWYPTGLGLFVTGPGIRRHALHAASSVPLSSLPAPIFVGYTPEPKLLRSFIDFTNPGDSVSHRITHGISVGFPEGAAFSYNLKSGALFQVWRGGFLNATPMWDNRGDGSSRPNGSVLALGDHPFVARLDSESAVWPDTVDQEAGFRPRGYRLDEAGRPAFLYDMHGVCLEDHVRVSNSGKALERRLRVTEGDAGRLYLRLAAGNRIEQLPNDWYVVDQAYYIQLPEKPAFEVKVRTVEGTQELIVPLNGAAEVNYTLWW